MSKAFLIAAPWSNSGKTTLTLGLLRWFSAQGYRVQPFKCGPDYIDAIHQTTAAGRTAINLDTVMMPETHVKTLFHSYTAAADLSIVEGVMGLFDGAVKDKGSTASIAKLLDIPVILVVNAKSMAYTIAPILKGLKTFDPEVQIAGVIFNMVKTPSHYTLLKEASETVGIPCLGYVPPEDNIQIPSRHLGLHIDHTFDTAMDNMANHIAAHIEVPALLDYSKTYTNPVQTHAEASEPQKKYTIAIAKDEAFRFTYIENLKWLAQLGILVYFSPMHDTSLPEADVVYFPGGYPELHLNALSQNKTMQKQIKDAADRGVKIYAECGGMMYLGKTILDEAGKEYPMVGVFPYHTSMQAKKLSLGYRKIVWNDQELFGHEFHYSTLCNDEEIPHVGQVFSARDKAIATKIYHYKNVYASYIHVYWAALESKALCI